MHDPIVGLVAGGGRLPILAAAGMRAAGVRVCAVGLRDHFEPELPAMCDVFEVAGVYRLGRWIRVLRKHGASRVVIVGRVSKARMHDPLRVLRQLPDWRAAQVWYRRLGDDRRSSAVLDAVAGVLADAGITVIDSTTYIGAHLADAGLMTTAPPGPHQADIAAGWPVLQRTVELDIGQSIAVSRGRVIAIESLEGTDRMIDRAGRLDGTGSWTLLKAHRRQHDLRFDVPTVGLVTVERLKRAGGGCMALLAGGVIMVDKPQVIEAAERDGLCIIGLERS